MAATVAAPLERRLGEIAGHRPDHLDQYARHHQHPVAVRDRPQHRSRRARRAGRDQRLAGRSAERPAGAAEIPQGQSRRRAGVRAGADLEDDAGERDLRRRRHRAGAAHLAGRRASAKSPSPAPTSRRCGSRSIRWRCRMPGSPPTTCGLAIINANPLGPVGIFDGARQSETISTNKQMRTAAEFRDIIIKSVERQFRPAGRRRRGRGFRPQQPLDRLVQQAAGGADPDHQAGRRQRHRHRRPGQGAAARAQAMDARPASKSRRWSTAPAPSAPASTTCSGRCWRPPSW